MYCPRVRERVSRPGGGVISIMLFRILLKVVACLMIRLHSRVGHLRAVIRSAGFVFRL